MDITTTQWSPGVKKFSTMQTSSSSFSAPTTLSVVKDVVMDDIYFDPKYNIEVLERSTEIVTKQQLDDMLRPEAISQEQLAYLMEAPVRSFDMDYEGHRLSLTEDDIALLGGFEEDESVISFVERVFGIQEELMDLAEDADDDVTNEDMARRRQMKNRSLFRGIAARRYAQDVAFVEIQPVPFEDYVARPPPKDLPLPKVPFSNWNLKRTLEEKEEEEASDSTTLGIKKLRSKQ